MARVLISAGDRSGDQYAAALVREVWCRRPDIEFFGLGGQALESAGVRLSEHIDSMGAMGFVEILATIPRHASLLRTFRAQLEGHKVDLVILVDYPDFNFRIARLARRYGVPVLYYVAPQLWAWREWRARALRRDVTQLAVIFPFEQEYFRALGVRADWVGHPLLERAPPPTRSDARAALGIDEGATVAALLPGSRPHEISRLWPVFKQAAEAVRLRVPGVRFLVGAEVGEPGKGFIPCSNDVPGLLAAADVAMCKSGTISLEAALADVPMVIAYRVHPVSYALARPLVRVTNVGIVNLMTGSQVVPELIQKDATPQKIASAIVGLLQDKSAAERQRGAFRKIRAHLGESVASSVVADTVLRLIA